MVPLVHTHRTSQKTPPVWVFGLCGTIALSMCTVLRALIGPDFPALPCFAILTIAWFYFLAERRPGRPHARHLDPRDIAAGRLGLLVHLVVPVAGASLWLYAWLPLKAPLSPEPAVRGDLGAWIFTALLVFPLGIVGALVAHRVGRMESKRLNRLLLLAGSASTLLLCIASLSGLARSRGTVDPDRYLTTLTKVGQVSGNDVQPVSVEGVQVSIRCDRSSCAPQVEGRGIPRTTVRRSLYFPLRSDDPVLVFYDDRSGVVILRSAQTNRGWALRAKTGILSESLAFEEVSASVSPPRAWVIFGLLAALVSAVLIGHSAWHVRARGLVGGVADGTGRLLLSKGEVCTLSPSLGSYEGPVAARLGPAGNKTGGPYREAIPARTSQLTWAGTVEQAGEWLQDEASARLALAFVMNCFSLVPLVVGSYFGLVL